MWRTSKRRRWLLALLPLFCLLGNARGQVSPTVAEQYLLAAANRERAALGLGPLHRDPLLAQAAAAHAQSMAAHRGISHQFPGEPELSQRGASAGVRFSLISENVGEAPSAVTIHDMWMHSPHHRENLLDPGVNAAGISVVERGGELYAVEDFAKTVDALTLDEQETAVAALLAQQGIAVAAETTTAARQTCALASGYAGPLRPAFVIRFTSSTLTALPSQLAAKLATGKYRQAAVGACAGTGPANGNSAFTSYSLAVMLFP